MDELDRFIEFYQEKHTFPTEEEDPKLYELGQSLRKKTYSFQGRENYFKFRRFRIDVALNELLEYMKVHHAIPQKEVVSTFGTNLRRFYFNLYNKKYQLTDKQEEIYQAIFAFLHYDDTMLKDIYTYYQTYQKLPPVGTKNALQEDLGLYYKNLQNQKKLSWRQRALINTYSIPYDTKAKRKNDELVDQIVQEYPNISWINQRKLYDLLRHIKTGRKQVSEEQKEKLKSVGILPGSDVVYSLEERQNRFVDRLIEEKENLTYSKNALLYQQLYTVRAGKRIISEENTQKLIDAGVLKEDSKIQERKRKNLPNMDHFIEKFVSYVQEHHRFPREDTDLMDAIQKVINRRYSITYEQYQKLEEVLSFSGRSLRDMEKEYLILEIIQILQEKKLSTISLKEAKELLPPYLFHFLQNASFGRIQLNYELEEKLEQIGISCKKVSYDVPAQSNLTENVMLLQRTKELEKKLHEEKERLQQSLRELKQYQKEKNFKTI